MTAVRKTGIRLMVLMLLIMTISACSKKAKDDRQILDDYLANKEAEYNDEEKTKIVTAYKNLSII